MSDSRLMLYFVSKTFKVYVGEILSLRGYKYA